MEFAFVERALAFPAGKETPVPLGQNFGWALELVWMM
jgi:hypothetical protein